MKAVRGFVNRNVTGIAASLGVTSANDQTVSENVTNDKDSIQNIIHLNTIAEIKKSKYSCISTFDDYVATGHNDGSLQVFQTDSEGIIFEEIFNKTIGKQIDQVHLVDKLLFVLVDSIICVYDIVTMKILDDVDCGAYQFSVSGTGVPSSQIEFNDMGKNSNCLLYVSIISKKRPLTVYRWDRTRRKLQLKCELPCTENILQMMWFPAQSDYIDFAKQDLLKNPSKLGKTKNSGKNQDSTSTNTGVSKFPAPSLQHSLPSETTDFSLDSVDMTSDNFTPSSFGTFNSFTPHLMGSMMMGSSYADSYASIDGDNDNFTGEGPNGGDIGLGDSDVNLTSQQLQKHEMILATLPYEPILLFSTNKSAISIAYIDSFTIETLDIPFENSGNNKKLNLNQNIAFTHMPYGSILITKHGVGYLVDYKGQFNVLSITTNNSNNSNPASSTTTSTASVIRIPTRANNKDISPSPPSPSQSLNIFSTIGNTLVLLQNQQCSFIEFPDQPSFVTYHHPYLISHYSNELHLLNPFTSSQYPSFPFPSKNMYLSSSHKHHVVINGTSSTSSIVSTISITSLSLQISKLSKSKLYGYALQLCALSLPSQWQHGILQKTYQQQTLSITSALLDFSNGNYESALHTFQMCNCNPKLVLSLYPQLFPSKTNFDVTHPFPINTPNNFSDDALRSLSVLIPYLHHLRQQLLRHLQPTLNSTSMSEFEHLLGSNDNDITSLDKDLDLDSEGEGEGDDFGISPSNKSVGGGNSGFSLNVIENYEGSDRNTNTNTNTNTTTDMASHQNLIRKPSHLGKLSNSFATNMLIQKNQRSNIDPLAHFTIPSFSTYLTKDLLSMVDTAIVMTYLLTDTSPIVVFLSQTTYCPTNFISKQLIAQECFYELVQFYKSRDQHSNALFVIKNNLMQSLSISNQRDRKTPTQEMVSYLKYLMTTTNTATNTNINTNTNTKSISPLINRLYSTLHGIPDDILYLVLEYIPWVAKTDPHEVLSIFLPPDSLSYDPLLKTFPQLNSMDTIANYPNTTLAYPPTTALAIFNCLCENLPSNICSKYLQVVLVLYGNLFSLLHVSNHQQVIVNKVVLANILSYFNTSAPVSVLLSPVKLSTGVGVGGGGGGGVGVGVGVGGGGGGPPSPALSSASSSHNNKPQKIFSESNILKQYQILQTLHTELACRYILELLPLLSSTRVTTNQQFQQLIENANLDSMYKNSGKNISSPPSSSVDSLTTVERIVDLRISLYRFLCWSSFYNINVVLNKLPSLIFIQETGELLHKLGKPSEVLKLYVSRDDYAGAERYCIRNYQENNDKQPFLTLMTLYLEQCHNEEEAVSESDDQTNSHVSSIVVAGANTNTNTNTNTNINSRLRTNTIKTSSNANVPIRTLHSTTNVGSVFNSTPSQLQQQPLTLESQVEMDNSVVISGPLKAALCLLANHPYALDVATAIDLIPSHIPLHQTLFFLTSLMTNTTMQLRQHQVQKNLLKYEALKIRHQLFKSYQNNIVITDHSSCFICHKKIGSSAFAAINEKQICHYVCYVNNEHLNLPNHKH